MSNKKVFIDDGYPEGGFFKQISRKVVDKYMEEDEYLDAGNKFHKVKRTIGIPGIIGGRTIIGGEQYSKKNYNPYDVEVNFPERNLWDKFTDFGMPWRDERNAMDSYQNTANDPPKIIPEELQELYPNAQVKSYSDGVIPDTEVRSVDGEDSRVNLYEAKLIDDYGSVGETMVKDIGSGDIGPDGKRKYTVASGDFEYDVAGTFAAHAKMEALKRKEREDQRKEDKLERSKKIQALGTTASIAYKGQQAWDAHSKIKADEMVKKDFYTAGGKDDNRKYKHKDSRFLDTRSAKNRVQETEEYAAFKAEKDRLFGDAPIRGDEGYEYGKNLPKGGTEPRQESAYGGVDPASDNISLNLPVPKMSDKAIAKIKADEQKTYDDAGVENLEEYRDKREVFRGQGLDIEKEFTQEELDATTPQNETLDWRKADIKQTDEYGSAGGAVKKHFGTGSGQSVAQEMSEKFYAEYGDDVQFNEQGLPIPKRPNVPLDIGEDDFSMGDKDRLGSITMLDTGDYPGDTGLWDKPPPKGADTIPEGFQGGPKGDIRLKDKDLGSNLLEEARTDASTIPRLQMQIGGEEAGSIKQFIEDTGMEYTPENFEKWQNYELPSDLGEPLIASTDADTWASAQELTSVVQNSDIITSGADEIINEMDIPAVTPESAGDLIGGLGLGLAKNAATGVGLELGKDLLADITGIEDETVDTVHNVYKGAKTVKSAFDTVKTAKAAKDVGTAAAGSGGAAGGALIPGLSIAAGAFQMLTADEPEDKIAGGVTALGGALMFTPLAPLGAVMVAGSSLWSIFS